MTLSASQAIQSRIINELESIWKDMLLSPDLRHSPADEKESHAEIQPD
jgi:hypothetical protein